VDRLEFIRLLVGNQIHECEVSVAKSNGEVNIFLEMGKKKVFAGATDWPGWCRFGRDEETAMRVLCDYGSRYGQILSLVKFVFIAPKETSEFNIIERVAGNATTDFGGIDAVLTSDSNPIEDDEMERFQAILKACWKAFDKSVSAAEGKELRKGPRGGGRDLERIVDHVLMADEAYLKRIGWKPLKIEDENLYDHLRRIRGEIFDGLMAASRGELPSVGPRGGKRWTPRFFVRRLAWHVVDHTWEIEDRIL
jgi:hypothetical protein